MSCTSAGFRMLLVMVAGWLFSAGPAWAQGVIVIHYPDRPAPLPRPIPLPEPQPRPQSYKINHLSVDAKLQDQVAQVQVSQKFENTGSQQMEVSFLFPLPYDGAIDSLTLMVEGKEYPAKLLEKDKAQQIYQSIVRQNKDPALLQWMGSGMFQTSVFPVPAGATREVQITYSQLLKKDGRLTDFLFPLSTAQYTDKPVEKVRLRLSLESSDKLKSIYSPTHEVDIERNGDHRAVVEYEAKDTVPATDFRLFFDTSQKELSASVISYRPDKDEEGFFLLLASPPLPDENAEPPKKTVLFVVDRSGSMSGEKMKQAREAAKYVLNNLNQEDLFNIVAYDSDVESFKPELQRANEESVQAALGFVDGLYAGGSTNIHGALTTAMKMVQDDDRPCYILFLSDGRPTHGETDEMKIVEAAKEANRHDARVINFGVGYDVNSRLMDRLSRACRGQSQYVRPDEDLEEHVARLYRKINAPVMTDVKIKFDLEEADGQFVNRLLPEEVVDLFAGEQLVQVGRYKKAGDAKITIRGKVQGEEETYDFAAKFVEHSPDQSHSFVEKIWAMRRIGEIIDQLDLHGKNDELLEELVRLSTEHGILTPYTSFLADENQTVEELADARRGGGQSLERLRFSTDRLNETAGRGGFDQRALKQQFRQAEGMPATPGFWFGRSGDFGGMPADANLGAAVQGRLGRTAEPDADAAQAPVADAVRQIGSKTLFRRGEVWIDQAAADVDPAKDQNQYQEVKRFSDEYFDLIANNTPEENRVLAQQRDNEKLLVKLQGHVYLIVP